MAASILHKIGHLVRIPPLLSGDQPFVSWHSIQLCFHISITNTPRGHEDGELMFKRVVLRLAQGRCFTIINKKKFTFANYL